MRREHKGLALLLVAGALLAVNWLAFPGLAPPLYDGIILPEQPYRYLQPPPGMAPGKPPSVARFRVAASEEKTLAEFVYTGEQPPQASLILAVNGLTIPDGVTHLTIWIRPVPPPGAPAGGSIEGNVYWFGATADTGASLPMRKGTTATVNLRGTGVGGTPVIEQYLDRHWISRHTQSHLGTDIFSTTVTRLGYFALVLPSKAPPAQAGSGTSIEPYLVISGIVVVLLAAGLLTLRVNRQHRASTTDDPASTRSQAERSTSSPPPSGLPVPL